MKKLFLLCFLNITILFANNERFRVNDVPLKLLSTFHTNKKQNNFDTGGIHCGLDYGFDIYKQNFCLQFNTGSNLKILDINVDSFSLVNILYEIRPKIINWMTTKFYGDISDNHLSYDRFPSIPINNTFFNVPLGTRLMLLSEHRISLGLQFQDDLNYDNNTQIFSTVIKYNFNNKPKNSNP